MLFRSNEEEFPELWTAARHTALDQLTVAQRKKWDELLGAKLSFDPVKHLRTFGHILNRVGEPAPEPPVIPPAGQQGGPGVQPGPGVPQVGPLPARAPGALPPPDLPLVPTGGPGTLPPLPPPLLPPAPPIMR